MDDFYDAGTQLTQDAKDTARARFHMQARKDEKASSAAGRPIFTDVEYVEIHVPGDKLNIIHRPARPKDKKRFAGAYRAFKAGQEQGVAGTPLAEWPQVTRSQVEELKYHGVHTVEQLAAVTDGNVQNIGPILALRAKAQAYLEAARVGAPSAALAERDARIAALESKLEALVAHEEKRGPGRPKKVQTEAA